MAAPAILAHHVGDERTFARARRARDANDVRAPGVLVQLCQIAAALRHLVFDQRHHAGQGAAIAIEETFNNILQGTLHLNLQAIRMDIGAHKIDNLLGRSSRPEAALNAHRLNSRNILVGQNAPGGHQHIIYTVFP